MQRNKPGRHGAATVGVEGDQPALRDQEHLLDPDPNRYNILFDTAAANASGGGIPLIPAATP